HEGLLSEPLVRSVPKGLERRNVRRLQALVALHDFERHALTLGQRLVALTGNRGEVDEHVRLAVTALDEAVDLFVREPLDRAFSHLQLLLPGWLQAPTFGALGRLAPFQPGNASPPRRNRAARTAFWSRQAIVIGPTPPGTGVKYAATSSAPGSTSPTRPASVRLMPTSMTRLPAFTMSAVTSAGTPTAAMRTSASSVWRGRSFVCEWQIVTVAFACIRSCAIGFPTMSLRPRTTARAPSSSI